MDDRIRAALFDLDGVKLEFTEDAVRAVARDERLQLRAHVLHGQQQKTVRTHVELGILHARQLARHHAEEDVPPRHIVRK